jgi:hypothetical protein
MHGTPFPTVTLKDAEFVLFLAFVKATVHTGRNSSCWIVADRDLEPMTLKRWRKNSWFPSFMHGTAHTPQCTTPHRARVSLLQHIHHNAPHHTGQVYRYCSTYTTMHHNAPHHTGHVYRHCSTYTTIHHTTQGTCIVAANPSKCIVTANP